MATATTLNVYQASVLTQGVAYDITFTVSDYVSGSVRVKPGISAVGTTRSANGTYTETIICLGSDHFYIDGVTAFTGKIDDVIVLKHEVESWEALGANTIENDSGALKITYDDNAAGARHFLRETWDLATDLVVGVAYKLKVKAKVNAGTINIKINTTGNDPIIAWTETDFTWKEIIFVADHALTNYLALYGFGAGEIFWIDEWSLELADGIIPALADKSADALGGPIQYPQNAANAIPETYFKLPENIAELIAADQEERYMDIMDAGKGVFTPDSSIMDEGKGIFTPITDNLVTNGTFDTDTDWTKESGWAISGGTANATASIFTIYQAGLTIGKIYEITYTISDYVAGTVKSRAGNTSGASNGADGTYSDILLCSVSGNIYIDGVSSFTGKIDNISAVEQEVESWITYGTNIIENDAGALKITYVDHASGAYTLLTAANDLSEEIVVNNWYKLRVRAKRNQGSALIRIYNGVGQDNLPDLTTDYAWYELSVYLTATGHSISITGLASGDILWIDEWELIPQNIESWTAYGANIMENDSGVLKITYSDNASGAYVYLRETADINTNLTIGKNYILSVKAKGTGTVTIRVNGGTTWTTQELTTEYVWYNLDFLGEHAANGVISFQLMGAGEVAWLAEYSIHESVLSTGNNVIVDSEGFRWDDNDVAGVGDGWSHYTGTGTPAIVTGNGFVGNAQQINHVNGANTGFSYSTGVNAINGQVYQVTGKFRADQTLWRLYLRTVSDSFTGDLGINTSDAASFSYTVTASATAEIILNFYQASANPTSYLEVDELEVRPVIPSFFYEPLALGLTPVVIKTDDLPAYRYLTQYYNETNRKDLLLLEAGHSLDGGDHNKLLKFTKNN